MTWAINGTDPRGLGLIVSDVPRWTTAVELRANAVTIPGRAGQTPMDATRRETPPRRLVARGIVEGSSVAVARANADALAALFSAPALLVSFADAPTRGFVCELETFTIETAAAQIIARKVPVTIALVAYDPMAYDTVGSVVAFSGVAAAIPLGNAPVAPVIRIMGPATNPVLTYRDKSGVAQQTMGFTVTLGANDYLELDCDRMTATLYASGVSSNGLALLTSGDFVALDPLDADYPGSGWPTLETSAGSGEVIYRRAWY